MGIFREKPSKMKNMRMSKPKWSPNGQAKENRCMKTWEPSLTSEASWEAKMESFTAKESKSLSHEHSEGAWSLLCVSSPCQPNLIPKQPYHLGDRARVKKTQEPILKGQSPFSGPWRVMGRWGYKLSNNQERSGMRLSRFYPSSEWMDERSGDTRLKTRKEYLTRLS